MSIKVWAVWPTINKNQSQEMINIWQSFGYSVAILINPPYTHNHFSNADIVIIQKKWKGFPIAANILCKKVSGDIVVVVGDDVYPDPNSNAEQIGSQFLQRFPDLYGVMQPTGDEFGCYDDCAVSPWIGRKFIEKAYNGNGPYREEYFHYFSDQELQEYAIKMNAFEQFKYIVQFHDHWQRKENPQRPNYLIQAKVKWKNDKQIFEQRKAKGFPNGNF